MLVARDKRDKRTQRQFLHHLDRIKKYLFFETPVQRQAYVTRDESLYPHIIRFHVTSSTPTTMNPPPPQSHALVRPSAFSNFPLLPADQLPFNSPRTTFHHPGYPDMDNVLFSLSPIDNGGVHYGTALSACIIFACNVKGYLATSRGDPDRNRDFDEILTARKYYYYAASSVPKYPVCASFDDWVFPAEPANIMPPSWLEAVVSTSQRWSFGSYIDIFKLSPETMSDNSAIPMGCSQMSYAVTVRDQSCRMSGTRDVCQNAHLVPLANARWVIVLLCPAGSKLTAHPVPTQQPPGL